MMHDHPHVERRDATFYLHGQRVPLYAVVLLWREGESAEEIAADFPVLSLADVYDGIAYYLDHQDELDRHFAAWQQQEAATVAAWQSNNAERRSALHQRLAAVRAQREASAS